jgi:hypothetical protein
MTEEENRIGQEETILICKKMILKLQLVILVNVKYFGMKKMSFVPVIEAQIL